MQYKADQTMAAFTSTSDAESTHNNPQNMFGGDLKKSTGIH
jgi:hypothetical protein